MTNGDARYMTPGARKVFMWLSLWLAAISLIVAVSAVKTWTVAGDTDENSKDTAVLVDDLADTRGAAILDSCHGDQAQNEVLRTILNVSLELQTEREAKGIDQDGPDQGPQERRELAEDLMAPLGGLDATSDELKAECQMRLDRGTP